VLVKGKMTPMAPASSARFAVQSSLTGTRTNGIAFRPRVASTMLRSVSQLIGLCSISIQRKSKPMLAVCAATSGLATVMVPPITGLPSARSCRTGFCHFSAAAEAARPFEHPAEQHSAERGESKAEARR
jgi:hypothetical protein